MASSTSTPSGRTTKNSDLQEPSDLGDHDIRAMIGLLTERVGQLLLLGFSGETEAAIDRIDAQIFELKDELQIREGRGKSNETETPQAQGHSGRPWEAEGIVRKATKTVVEATTLAHNARKIFRDVSRNLADGERHESKLSPNLSAPGPHIPITDVNRQTLEHGQRNDHHKQRGPSPSFSNPNPQTSAERESAQAGNGRSQLSPNLTAPGPHLPSTEIKKASFEKQARRDRHRQRSLSIPKSQTLPSQPNHPSRVPRNRSRSSTQETHSPPTTPTPAQTAYTLAFPHGHRTLPTPGTGLLCGFHATILSLRAQHPTLPLPTLISLRRILKSPSYSNNISGSNLTNTSNFHVDQVGAVLYLWGQGEGLNLQLGYLPEGGEPGLVPLPEGEGRVVVWIGYLAPLEEGGVGHYEGVRARGRGRRRQSRDGGRGNIRRDEEGRGSMGEGVHRRVWVKKLDEKVTEELRRWQL